MGSSKSGILLLFDLLEIFTIVEILLTVQLVMNTVSPRFLD